MLRSSETKPLLVKSHTRGHRVYLHLSHRPFQLLKMKKEENHLLEYHDDLQSDEGNVEGLYHQKMSVLTQNIFVVTKFQMLQHNFFFSSDEAKKLLVGRWRSQSTIIPHTNTFFSDNIFLRLNLLIKLVTLSTKNN